VCVAACAGVVAAAEDACDSAGLQGARHGRGSACARAAAAALRIRDNGRLNKRQRARADTKGS
jgi:hypothetical protein